MNIGIITLLSTKIQILGLTNSLNNSQLMIKKFRIDNKLQHSDDVYSESSWLDRPMNPGDKERVMLLKHRITKQILCTVIMYDADQPLTIPVTDLVIS